VVIAPRRFTLLNLRQAAGRPVSGASAAFFRIAFGVAMFVNCWLYLPRLLSEYYLDTSLHFSYGWFTFIQPPPGYGIHVVYVVMSVLAILIALGLWYRVAVAGFFVLHTYVFLIDSTFFQNHEYLISLVSFLMTFLPLQRRWSVDARRRPPPSVTIPVWVVWLLRFQIGIVYFYGGVAKLNADWFQAEPLRKWLHSRTDVPLIGQLFEVDAVVWIMAYGSLIFDLTIVFFLLNRRTRVAAFVLATGFHLVNVKLFGLFVFPWLMIAATTIFFSPDLPERVLARLRGTKPTTGPAAELAAATPGDTPSARRSAWLPASMATVTVLAVWVIVQLVVPLRHYLIPGHPNWTEEAHRFSWHMKLRDKSSSDCEFEVWRGDDVAVVSGSSYLNEKQVDRLCGHPERLVRFAHFLSNEFDGAEVRALTEVSLNGRERVPIVDPDVDLASVPTVWWGHAGWILPLDEPLPSR
jgi:hypothetical protein